MRRDRLPPADGVTPLVRPRLDVDLATEDAGKILDHLRLERAEARSFGEDRDVTVHDEKPRAFEIPSHLLEEDAALGPLPLGIGVGEMRTDVAGAESAANGIDN